MTSRITFYMYNGHALEAKTVGRKTVNRKQKITKAKWVNICLANKFVENLMFVRPLYFRLS